jgi:hypothetical protein
VDSLNQSWSLQTRLRESNGPFGEDRGRPKKLQYWMTRSGSKLFGFGSGIGVWVRASRLIAFSQLCAVCSLFWVSMSEIDLTRRQIL